MTHFAGQETLKASEDSKQPHKERRASDQDLVVWAARASRSKHHGLGPDKLFDLHNSTGSQVQVLFYAVASLPKVSGLFGLVKAAAQKEHFLGNQLT